ncbi:MBL fold metallo-hydrolase [Kordiimonas laminariae]|uniref:MBL fold metallo-hydrolase n=1 Tax=Kordiimonas laminariae TaxID=2917717 RepID=UPI001FF1BD4D|nr:MBL fold metallo-hydrolase [Kordiimonas laminariae]
MLKVLKGILIVLVLLIVIAAAVIYSINAKNIGEDKLARSTAFNGEKFVNIDENKKAAGDIWKIISAYRGLDTTDHEPTVTIPVQKVTRAQLDALPDNKTHIIKLGHSSLLIKGAGKYWLVDPVFSERASPFSFLGPKRFHEAPISMDALPEIEGIIISHNHYDHLDKGAIQTLKAKTNRYFVPLGISGDLISWGVDENRIEELVWWESIEHAGLKLTSVPAQHFSGRGVGDSNITLWTAWVLDFGGDKIFYSGDGGYAKEFARIGEKLGPFDITFMEVGAYNELWPDIHMTPEQAVQAHVDLNGRFMVPVHNGTFNLAMHTWYEPFDCVLVEADQKNIELIIPKFGHVITLDYLDSYSQDRWWQKLK